MWYDQLFAGGAAVFGVPAVVGSAFFVLRIVLSALGSVLHIGDGHGMDHSVGHSVGHDLSHGAHAGAHHGSHVGASGTHSSLSVHELFSLQSIGAFLAGFGWTGLIGLVTLHWIMLASAAIGLAGGVVLSAGVIGVYRGFRRLESAGTVGVSSAVGLEGEVYLTIPERGKGAGQIRVVLAGQLKVVDAVSRDRAVPTGEKVLVVGTGEGNCVIVQAVPG